MSQPTYLDEVDQDVVDRLTRDDPNLAAGDDGLEAVDHEQQMGPLALEDDDPVIDAEIAAGEPDLDEDDSPCAERT